MKITVNSDSVTAYRAADEFARMLPLVCSGEFVNAEFSLLEAKEEDSFSVSSDGNDIFFAGGCPRALLYAVYDYFEKCYRVHYFWDGDVYPEQKLPPAPAEINETPRFHYRGLRYFAHRTLYRFQAEEWGRDDWERELDWLIKKKFNMFMLRLGNRNSFERAFPDIVPTDDTDGCKYPNQKGFSERTPIRSGSDDEELEQFINSRADLLSLIRPTDCGTMTHWYSQTPESFLDAKKPRFLSQTVSLYGDPRSLVWDIRNEYEMSLYFALTDSYEKAFGGKKLFHTIGLAERLFSEDRKENLALKKYTYREICRRLNEKYPDYRLLIASWDFSMFWSNDEVRELLSELAPERCIIFDYTSDTKNESNFTKWGVCGKFPYIFGIFHAYEPQNDIRNDYSLLESRLKLASSDEKCIGFVTWQELSHGDGFMLDYTAQCAWKPDLRPHSEQTDDYCARRFGRNASAFAALYRLLTPLASLSHWGGDRKNPERNTFLDFSMGNLTIEYEKPIFAPNIGKERLASLSEELKKFLPVRENAGRIIEETAKLYPELESEGERREAFDMVRTAASKYLHFEIIKAALPLYNGDFGGFEPAWERIIALERSFTKLLGTHCDYSICSGIDRMKAQGHVNAYFAEHTIKENSDNVYCRTCAYELMAALTLPEFEAVGRWLSRCESLGEVRHDELLESEIADIHRRFSECDLYEYAPEGVSASGAMKELAALI